MSLANSITVVSGLPRSGTSLMMQMLANGGRPPVTDGVRPADESNPRGYYEDKRVMRLRTDRTWLSDARGRAVKIIHVHLHDLPTDAGYIYRVIFLRRRMEEVIASQRAMLARNPRPGATEMDAERLAAAFEAQLVRTAAFLRAHAACFSVLEVDHHALLAEPAAVAVRINEFLGGGLEVEKMAAGVDLSLWRQRAASS